jgi:RHS repeat-associated protein
LTGTQIRKINFKRSATVFYNGTLSASHHRTHDDANQVTSIETRHGANGNLTAIASQRDYVYDAAGQRTKVTLADDTHWDYTYDSYGQVTGATKKTAQNAPIPTLGQTYAYDSIGNRASATDTTTTAAITYSANNLNQYTGINHPGSLSVLGTAAADTDVTLNGNLAARAGKYYGGTVTGDNTASPVWLATTVQAIKPDGGQNNGPITKTQTGHLYLPKAQTAPTYDDDGNLTNDGRWLYSWDAENRLIAMEPTQDALTAGVPRQKVAYTYDGQSRRIQRQTYTWDPAQNNNQGGWAAEDSTLYLYQGWTLLAEYKLHNSSFILHTSYLWSLDLANSLTATGQVGALYAQITHSPLPLGEGQGEGVQSTYALLPGYDANGNIVTLIVADTAQLAATYDYDAFGRQIERKLFHSSPFTLHFSYGFSTKPLDPLTNLHYYGYRFYNADMGRWLNRDPIVEMGGLNLYGITHNDIINGIDNKGQIPPLIVGFLIRSVIISTVEEIIAEYLKKYLTDKIKDFLENPKFANAVCVDRAINGGISRVDESRFEWFYNEDMTEVADKIISHITQPQEVDLAGAIINGVVSGLLQGLVNFNFIKGDKTIDYTKRDHLNPHPTITPNLGGELVGGVLPEWRATSLLVKKEPEAALVALLGNWAAEAEGDAAEEIAKKIREEFAGAQVKSRRVKTAIRTTKDDCRVELKVFVIHEYKTKKFESFAETVYNASKEDPWVFTPVGPQGRIDCSCGKAPPND